MGTPVSDVVQEAQVAGKFIRGVGPVIVLSIAVLVLCVALGFTMVTAKVGADRWTRTDHDSYVMQHDRDENALVAGLLQDHTAVHKEEAAEDKHIASEVSEIHEDVAVLKSTVERMEVDLQIIKRAVTNIERNGSN